jgi:hypothetical protein
LIDDPKLAPLVGTWAGEEQLLPTQWTPVGSEGTLPIAAALHAGVLIDYTETRDGVAALRGDGTVVGSDWWWFDSYGLVPTQPGVASWNGSILSLERRTDAVEQSSS